MDMVYLHLVVVVVIDTVLFIVIGRAVQRHADD